MELEQKIKMPEAAPLKCKGSSIKMYLFIHFRVKIIEYQFKAKNGVLI